MSSFAFALKKYPVRNLVACVAVFLGGYWIRGADCSLDADEATNDPARAVVHQKACDGGDARGCFNLGFVYANGEGVTKDLARAAELYQKACEGGDANGCNNLGVQYAKGEGVGKDLVRATELQQKACEGGDARGCFNLGGRYANGEGVGKDLARATELQQKACDGGVAKGCFNLGVQYAKGEGVGKDLARAAELHQKACDGGDSTICHESVLAPTNIRRKPSANPFPKDAPRTHKAIWRPCLTTRVKVVAA
jgi:TPR repeat protein